MIWLNDLKFVKVYKVEDKGNFVKAQLSTSEKKQDGTYENSSWFASFVGGAKEQAKHLQDKDTITITKGNITNVYNKEAGKSYLNMTIFEFTGGEKKDINGINDDFSFGAGSFEDYTDVDDSCPF